MDNLAKGIFAVVIITTIQLYFWCCVFSLYQLFSSEELLLPINNSIQMTQTNTDLPPNYFENSTPINKGADQAVPDYSSIRIY